MTDGHPLGARPPGMPLGVDPRVPPGAIAFAFDCSICGRWAMRVMALTQDDPEAEGADAVIRTAGRVVVEAGFGTGAFGGGTDAAIQAAIAAGDLAALGEVDRELVPLWCPNCARVYCTSHWDTWDVFDEEMPSWFDEKRGICPEGHERMIWD